MTDSDGAGRNGKSSSKPYKVGYRSPPLHTRFKPKTSGNPSGRPARSKHRDVRQSIVDVYTQEVTIGDGRSKRKVPAIVVIHERLLRNALKGDNKAAVLVAKFAAEFRVNDIKDEIFIDPALLTPEERDILFQAWPILEKIKASKRT